MPATLQRRNPRNLARLLSSKAMLRVCASRSSSLHSSIFSRCPTSSRATSSTTTLSSHLALDLWVCRPPTTPQSCLLARPWDRLRTGSSMLSHHKSRHKVLLSSEVVAEVAEEVVPRIHTVHLLGCHNYIYRYAHKARRHIALQY